MQPKHTSEDAFEPPRYFDPQVHGCLRCQDGRHPCEEGCHEEREANMPTPATSAAFHRCYHCKDGRTVCLCPKNGELFKNPPVEPPKRPAEPVYFDPKKHGCVTCEDGKLTCWDDCRRAKYRSAEAPPKRPIPVTDAARGRDGRRYVTVGGLSLYASPAEEEMIRMSAMEQAKKENLLAAEAMGMVDAKELEAAAAAPDNVHLPKHYARFKIEPISFICENGLNFFQGNVVKYVLRHDAKNGLEDIRKAKRYLEMYEKYLQGDTEWWK